MELHELKSEFEDVAGWRPCLQKCSRMVELLEESFEFSDNSDPNIPKTIAKALATTIGFLCEMADSHPSEDPSYCAEQAPILNDRRKHSTALVVLNDGETYTSLEGCRIVFVSGPPDFPEFDDEDVEEAYKRDFIEISSLI